MIYSSKTTVFKTTTNKTDTEVVTVTESKITERKFNLQIKIILTWLASIIHL